MHHTHSTLERVMVIITCPPSPSTRQYKGPVPSFWHSDLVAVLRLRMSQAVLTVEQPKKVRSWPLSGFLLTQPFSGDEQETSSQNGPYNVS